MVQLDIDFIRKNLKEKNYQVVMNHYFERLNTLDERDLIGFFEGVHDLITRNVILTKSQLNSIKDYFDQYGEAIQCASLDVYFSALLSNQELLKSEFRYCNENTKTFDPLIRERFIDFFIQIFPDQSDLFNDILSILRQCLTDEHWRIRLKIVDFFRNLMSINTQSIKSFNKDFLILLYESDLDVSSEALDFLFRLIKTTFSVEDVAHFVNAIAKNQWIAQDHALWLIGRLGITNPDLIKPFVKDIILLLENDDPLLQNRTIQAIEEVINEHPSFFDDALFDLVFNETLQNFGAVEKILIFSFEKGGVQRFIQIYLEYSSKGSIFVNLFASILRVIHTQNPTFAEKIINNLTKTIRQTLLVNISFFKEFLKKIPIYTLFLNVYEVITESEYILPNNQESLRQDLILFLTTLIPELGYYNMAKWIKERLTLGNVPIMEICQRFSIAFPKLIELLNTLIVKNLLDAIITEDMLSIPKVGENFNPKEELVLNKKWNVYSDLETQQTEIEFSIKLENLSDQPITSLNVILVNPNEVIVDLYPDRSPIQFQNILSSKESCQFSWKFKKSLVQFLLK